MGSTRTARLAALSFLGASLALGAACTPTPRPSEPRGSGAVGAPPPAADLALVLSDVHFDALADCAMANKCAPDAACPLSTAPVSQWRAIFEQTTKGRAWSRSPHDANYPLLESVLDAAAAAVPNPAFIIVPGDFLPHFLGKCAHGEDPARDAHVEKLAENILQFVTEELVSRFPTTPIFPVLGNNDTPDGDYRIPTGRGSDFLRFVARQWEPLVNRANGAPDFAASFEQGGYYTAKIPAGPRTRLVALDSVLWTPRNSDCCRNAPSEAGKKEIDWLDATLDRVQGQGESAWLLSHVPPGIDVFSTLEGGQCVAKGDVATMYCGVYAGPFLSTVAKHVSVVPFALGGHTHRNDYRLYRFGDGASLAHLLAPSVSPQDGNTPAFDVLRFDPKSGAVLDVTTTIVDEPSKTPAPKHEFDFDAEYHQAGFSAASVSAVRSGICADPAVRATYVRGYDSRSAVGSIEHDWQPYACGIDALSPADFKRCLSAQCAEPGPGGRTP